MKRTLVLLESFVGITAAISGLLLVLYPDGKIIHLPLTLLQFTPFPDFLIPGIILALVVGGVHLISAYNIVFERPERYAWSLWAGILLCGWLIVQIFLIRGANVLHAIYGAIGMAVIILTWRLIAHQYHSFTKQP